MTRARRWGRLLGASGVGVLGLLLVLRLAVGVGGPATQPGEVAASAGVPDVFEQKVEGQIAALAAESVLMSVAELGEPRSYMVPGPPVNRAIPAGFPMAPEVDQMNLDWLFSNRRFLKVCEELDALGEEEATELLNDAITTYLAEYRARLDASIEWTLAGGANRPGHERESPYVELRGMRFRLLGLVLVAGNLELTGTHQAILQVTQEALAQRERFYSDGEMSEPLRDNLLDLYSLYNRQVLGYALLATSPDPAAAADFLTAMGKQVVVDDLTTFDARCTRYETRLLRGPVDFSKGVLQVRYLEPTTDADFDVIVAALTATKEGETADAQQ